MVNHNEPYRLKQRAAKTKYDGKNLIASRGELNPPCGIKIRTKSGTFFTLCFLLCVFFAAPAIASDLAPSTDPRFKFSIDSYYKEPIPNPMGLFVDKEHGEVYIADRDKSEVFVFDSRGAPVFKFGSRETLLGITDLVVRDDRVYVSREGVAQIDVFNLRGVHMDTLTPPGKDFLPGMMALGDEGDIYIVNKKLGECLVLDSEDKFTGTIGKGLTSMSGVSARAGLVYFVSPFFPGNVVHVFKKTGEHVMSFEGIEGQGGTLGLPVSIKVDGAGNMWIADSIKGVVIYDKNARKINVFGWMGPASHRLRIPVDIDLGSEGMIYLIDKDKKRVSVFK